MRSETIRFLRSNSGLEVLMLSSTNFWMCFAGLIYLVAGVFILRKEISATRGWDKLITLGPVFVAVSLAVFAPEHFYGGPKYIQTMAPCWCAGSGLILLDARYWQRLPVFL